MADDRILVGGDWLTEAEFIRRADAGDPRAVELARFTKWAALGEARLKAVINAADAPPPEPVPARLCVQCGGALDHGNPNVPRCSDCSAF